MIRVTVLLAVEFQCFITGEDGFKHSASGVMSLITDESRVIILNHPNNLQEPFFFVM